MAKKYICLDCGRNLMYYDEPKFCPSCGGSNMVLDRQKSRKRAEEYLAKCQEMLPALEESYRAFIEAYVAYEDIVQVLRVYKRRGIISEDKMPTIFKPKLADSLKEYRQQKKELMKVYNVSKEAENGE